MSGWEGSSCSRWEEGPRNGGVKKLADEGAEKVG